MAKSYYPHYNKGKKTNQYLDKKDQESLEHIKNVINFKVTQRLKELREQKSIDGTVDFQNLKHVQINYFNTLALKPRKIPQAQTALNWGDAVIIDPISKIPYLCCIVYFDSKPLTAETFNMLLSLTSKVHDWNYSKRDDLYIDKLGSYVDKVDFEKQVETEGGTEDAKTKEE